MEASVAFSSTPSAPIRWNPRKFLGAIYDVGMHDGTDTIFYLHQGYAVLAIEADPVLAARAAERFAPAVQSGQLHVLNVGIARHTGSATFWICEDNSVWNSFDETIASRNGSRHHPVTIETRRFEDILGTFGVPTYLKIDIEGFDALCVEDLDRQALPRFISVESECVGDGVTLTASEATAMLTRLRDAGYTRFQLISQEDFRTATYPDRWRVARRLVDSAAFGKLRVLRLAPIAERFSHRERMRARHRYEFPCGGTGPWGPGLLGRWVDYETARSTYLGLRDEYFRNAEAKSYSFWYDWHATY
jgi:FkbM family methyltransferase